MERDSFISVTGHAKRVFHGNTCAKHHSRVCTRGTLGSELCADTRQYTDHTSPQHVHARVRVLTTPWASFTMEHESTS